MDCISNSTLRLGHVAAASVGLSAMLSFGCGMDPGEKAAQPLPNVKVAPVRLSEVAVQVPVVGTVTPSETSDVAAPAAGLVMEYPAKEGEFVRRGDTLAQLDTTGLEIEIEKAKAQLRQHHQIHQEMVKGYRPEEITTAKAAMLAAAADFEVAVARHARLERGRRTAVSAVSAQEFEEATIELERTRQTHAAAKADFEMKSSGHRAETIAAAEAAMQAQVQEVRRLQDQLTKHRVTAPFDGFVVSEGTDVGEWVTLGGVVARLVRLDEVEVRVNVNEAQVDQVRIGQIVDVRVDALGGESIAGRVEFIIPKSEWQQGSRSFPVVVRMKNQISNGVPQLKEGMVARITFRGPPRQGLLAHKDSIIRSAGLATVFVVEGDNTVRAVNVTEGLSEGEFIEVQGDLETGDLLVTDGVERLRPYDRVTIIDAPAPGDETNPTARTAGATDDSNVKSTGGD